MRLGLDAEAVLASVTDATEQAGDLDKVPLIQIGGYEMKHMIVVAMVLLSTAAKADWTPGTVMLVQFQQDLYTAHNPKEATAAGICARLKTQLGALLSWSKTSGK